MISIVGLLGSNIADLLKLLVIIAVPLWLMLARKHTYVLLWASVTLSIEALASNLLVNITPLSVIGLLYLPVVLRQLATLLATRLGKLILAYTLVLLSLGLVFGFLLPWPDYTGLRPINQLPQGRSIIYSVRFISEISFAVYVADQLRRWESPQRLLRYVLIGTTIASLGILFQRVTHFDAYLFFVPDARPLDFTRLRGLQSEPRVAGQIASCGLILLVGLRSVGSGRRYIGLAALHVLGLLMTVSTTGLLVLFGALPLAIVTRVAKWRRLVLLLPVVIACVASLQFVDGSMGDTWGRSIAYRASVAFAPVPTPAPGTAPSPKPLPPNAGRGFGSALTDPSGQGQQTSPAEQSPAPPAALTPLHRLAERVGYKLEVFDASAFLFLVNNPQYAILGTGPGLVTLPASNYVPVGIPRAIWGNRIDTPPFMGLVLIVANVGLIGLCIWAAIAVVGYLGLRERASTLAGKIEGEEWREAASYFIIFSGIYLIQARPVWYIFLGLALSAALPVWRVQAVQRPVSAHTPPSAAAVPRRLA